eukprot:2091662-Rhodomonas_salina.1
MSFSTQTFSLSLTLTLIPPLPNIVPPDFQRVRCGGQEGAGPEQACTVAMLLVNGQRVAAAPLHSTPLRSTPLRKRTGARGEGRARGCVVGGVFERCLPRGAFSLQVLLRPVTDSRTEHRSKMGAEAKEEEAMRSEMMHVTVEPSSEQCDQQGRCETWGDLRLKLEG